MAPLEVRSCHVMEQTEAGRSKNQIWEEILLGSDWPAVWTQTRVHTAAARQQIRSGSLCFSALTASHPQPTRSVTLSSTFDVKWSAKSSGTLISRIVSALCAFVCVVMDWYNYIAFMNQHPAAQITPAGKKTTSQTLLSFLWAPS